MGRVQIDVLLIAVGATLSLIDHVFRLRVPIVLNSELSFAKAIGLVRLAIYP